MTTITTRTAAFVGAAGIAVLVALSGCAGPAAVRAEPDGATGVTSATSAATTTPSTKPTSASSPNQGTAVGSGPTSNGNGSLRSTLCAASQLQGSLTVATGGGSAGHQAYELVFRNTASSPCALQGWPGVSFVGNGYGTQLGAAAIEDTTSAHGTVTIAAGSIAHATLLVADGQNYGDCGLAAADGFRVYPPGSKQSLFVDAGQLHLSACTDSSVQQLQVQAIQPGS